ncbi:MAG: SDR family oxidoreductase [Candidatus Sedimenticola sp. 20ELBAFRAG]
MNVLLTGATGFVGRAVSQSLVSSGFSVRGIARTKASSPVPGVEYALADLANYEFDWMPVLKGVEVVVHLASRVHVMRDRSDDPLSLYRAINTEGTLRLAQKSALAGVRRFIFVSSLKVNGETSNPGKPICADDVEKPTGPYATSKYEAEKGLFELADKTGMEVVVIRPPLVYGPGVRANFERMMYWLSKGLPLPFGSITENRRSLVALDNLVDLIGLCITHPAAVNQVFLASDGEDFSTSELLHKIALLMGVPSRQIRVPVNLLRLISFILGKQELATRLCDSLQVDISKNRDLLGWSPPVTADYELKLTVKRYLESLKIS